MDLNPQIEDDSRSDVSGTGKEDVPIAKGNEGGMKIDYNKISLNSRAHEVFPWNNLYWKRQSELLQELRDELYIDMEEVFTPKGN